MEAMVLPAQGVVDAIGVAGHGVPDGEHRGAGLEDMRREGGNGAAAGLQDAAPE